MKKREVRSTVREFRTLKTDAGVLVDGTAIVYNSLSEDLGGFREVIAPGACTDALASNDIFMLFNHESGKVLGRVSAKTLTLSEDETGVHFECLLPNNSLGADLTVSLDRGDIRSCSFGFFCLDDRWDNSKDGILIRTVLKADVFETSIVPMPAYPATTVGIARSLMFPDGLPVIPEVCSMNETCDADPTEDPTADDTDTCGCACEFCSADTCEQCNNDNCDAPNCGCNMRSMRESLLRARLALTS